MKQKKIAAILAFFLGMLGVHRFYLGQRFFAVLTIALTVVTFAISVAEGVPVILLAVLLAFIDSVLFAVMPQEEFDEKYNARYFSNAENESWKNWPEELNEKVAEPLNEIAAFAAVTVAPQEEKLSLDLLEQIAHYGKLRDQGLLTEDEFEVLKKRIL